MTTKVVFRKGKDGEPRTNRDGLTPIYIQYQHEQKTCNFQVLKADPNELEYVTRNGKLQLIDPYIRRGNGSKKKTDKIKELRNTIEELASELNVRNINPTVSLVKEQFNNSRKINTQRSDVSLVDLKEVYKRYLSHSDNTHWALGTKRQYDSTLSALERFEEYSGYLPKIHEFNLGFYDQFLEFLREVEKKQKNTAGNIIKNLKAFLNWARVRGFQVHPDSTLKSFKTIKERKEIIYLTQEEFKLLEELDLSENEKLSRVRDVFLFNCRTGMRYGDLKRFNKSHIKFYGDRAVIQIMQEKTNKQNYIPITSLPRKILEKYDYNLPIISEQRMNDYLKDLCEKAGITTPVETSLGIVSKHKLITTHVAIKTFITHCAENNMSPKTVSEITGKSLRVIMDHYYGTNKKTIHDEMAKAFG